MSRNDSWKLPALQTLPVYWTENEQKPKNNQKARKESRKKPISNQLTSGELLSNDRRAVGSGSS